MANQLATAAGQVAQMEAKLAGSAGYLAKFNAELAGGKFKGASAQWIQAMRSMAAEKDALADAMQGQKAEDSFQQKLGQMAGRVAELKAELAGGTGELEKFEAQVKAGLFAGVSEESLNRMREYLKVVEALTKGKEVVSVEDKLSKELAKAKEQADQYWNSFRSNTMEADKRANDLRARFMGMLDGIKATPEELKRVKEKIDEVIASVNQAEGAEVANRWREQAEQIERGLMDENAARERNYLEEVARQEALIQLTIRGTQARIDAEAAFARWKKAYDQQYMRSNENATVKMMRDWAKLSTNIQSVMANSFDSLVDGLFDAEFSFKKWAVSLLKEIAKVIIKAMIAYAILSALGMAPAGGFGNFMKGQLSAGFGGQGQTLPSTSPGIGDAVSVGGNAPKSGYQYGVAHTGGIIGRLSQSTMVDPSVFANAKKYHTGGSIGGPSLRPGEVPIIGMEGEAVLTEEQQAAIRNGLSAGASAPTVQVNVINNSDTQLDAEQGDTHFDGKEMIVNVIVEAAQRQGPLRNVMEQISRG
jgi:hypothetical protein